MRPNRWRCINRGERSRYSRRLVRLILGACALAFAGCEDEPRHPIAKPEAPSKQQEDPAPIFGERTQKVVDAAPALQKGDAKVASTKITAKDPITLVGNAYVTSIGRIAVLAIEDAVNKYHAANDRYPKDLDEFMTEIIKANNISLPKLPYYQEYSYDQKEHKLVVLEYPDRK
jgi:hypothetical protein